MGPSVLSRQPASSQVLKFSLSLFVETVPKLLRLFSGSDLPDKEFRYLGPLYMVTAHENEPRLAVPIVTVGGGPDKHPPDN